VRFWFTPIDPIALHAIRVLAGLLFLFWLCPFAWQEEAFFGLRGWIDKQAYLDAGRLPGGPPAPFSWSLLYLAGGDALLLTAIYWISIAVLVLFTIGLWTRVTGVLTWLVVVSYTANPLVPYEADALLNILAFYLMVGYLLFGQRDVNQPLLTRLLGSSATWFLGRRTADAWPSIGANIALRLLQVHFAIVVFVSGLHKLQAGEWWSGASFWYALHPPLETTMAQAREHASNPRAYFVLLSVGAYLTLAWQIGFPFFAWRRRWRMVLIGGAVAGWLGTAFMYKLPLFGPVYLIAALCYVTSAEWRWAISSLHRLPGLNGLARWLPATPDESPQSASRRSDAVLAVAARAR
jgi:hypothetical protein